MNDFSTPMMKQYREIKKQYPDCLLFYRMGDFYELFMEDAHIGAQVLNITLTSKSGGKDGKIPMAGVPYHAADTYLTKLVKAGYKVAICEQLSPPNKKGLVERDVVRIVTPGTLLDENVLSKKENNYIISVCIENGILAIAAADLSTGYFAATQMAYTDLQTVLQEELSKLHPSECILPQDLYNDTRFLKLLAVEKNMNIFPFSDWNIYTSDATKVLKKHFHLTTLESFDIITQLLAQQSAAALLGYLKETQKGTVSHIKKISSLKSEDGLVLDRSTIINLELFSTIRDHDTRGSLLSILDQTITPMGGRLLKQWIKKPLIEKETIEKRLDALAYFLDKSSTTHILRDQLKQIPDIERILSRLSLNLGNARDLVNLKNALQTILQTKLLLQDADSALLKRQSKNIATDLKKVVSYIDTMIVDEPPIVTREGRMIQPGVSKTLDKLRSIIGKNKSWIIELEKSEKEKTGIGSLKVRYNKVFGFYIEISNTNLHLVPDFYQRKQTLVNGERFVTKELKAHEEIILTAEEKINELEYTLFCDVLNYVLTYTAKIQDAAESIAVLDCISNFAFLSQKQQYTRPTIQTLGEIRIMQGRHPVVEKLLDETPFVPNDVWLDNSNQQLLVITGPNMAGKSVFIRQVAIIILMAQMGCFVPAQSAQISICDQIFVRSGASDVITSGLSTFMVEMVETAHILHNATKNSLIVMDEIGRGTSTYDGISIAWAVAEYLVTTIHPSPKTLFATHYHELQTLEEQYPHYIKNFHMAVIEDSGEPVFLHTLLPGGASHSFGVAVAKLAGIPESVIEKAYEMLQTLELRDVKEEKIYSEERQKEQNTTYEIPDTTIMDHILLKEIQALDIGNMTPLEALNTLAKLKDKLKLYSVETQKITID